MKKAIKHKYKIGDIVKIQTYDIQFFSIVLKTGVIRIDEPAYKLSGCADLVNENQIKSKASTTDAKLYHNLLVVSKKNVIKRKNKFFYR